MADGSKYDGLFQNDKQHGIGTFNSANKKLVYKGNISLILNSNVL